MRCVGARSVLAGRAFRALGLKAHVSIYEGDSRSFKDVVERTTKEGRGGAGRLLLRMRAKDALRRNDMIANKRHHEAELQTLEHSSLNSTPALLRHTSYTLIS